MIHKTLHECTWIEITCKTQFELWEDQIWKPCEIYPGFVLRVIGFTGGGVSGMWAFRTLRNEYLFRAKHHILHTQPLPWKEYQKNIQAESAKSAYPKNNDGRTTCAWCGAPTRKAGMGMYDYCDQCKK